MFDPRHKPILVLDEDEILLGTTVDTLSRIGYSVTGAQTLADAATLARERDFDLFLVAASPASKTIDEAVRELRRVRPRVPVVLLADPDEVSEAVALFRIGIEDYLIRPPQALEARTRLGRILERHELDSHVNFLQSEISKKGGPRSLVARSAAMEAVARRIERIAPMQSTVLILGESGVGKELAARAIHYHSARKNRPFIALNCAAIPESLIESELFGHEKGSFTGAFSRAPGKFEIAHRGTLFLDEIGEMRRETQARLLRVLEEREFMRVGGDQTISVDVRVIAATNANLERLLREGRLRRDLYFRLKVVTISIPPLRDRREDIPELSRFFLDEICRTNNLAPRKLSDEVQQSFSRYAWPGNVRELKNLLESLVVGTTSHVIDLDDLPAALRDGKGRTLALSPVRPGATMRDMERELIRQTLERTGGNRTHAARELAIGVRTLQRKIRSYGL